MDKALLASFRENHNFQQLMRSIHPHRPIVPTWKPQDTRDANEKLIEDIKYASAFQQGWDLLYATIMGVKHD